MEKKDASLHITLRWDNNNSNVHYKGDKHNEAFSVLYRCILFRNDPGRSAERTSRLPRSCVETKHQASAN